MVAIVANTQAAVAANRTRLEHVFFSIASATRGGRTVGRRQQTALGVSLALYAKWGFGPVYTGERGNINAGVVERRRSPLFLPEREP
jgi:hypothetical protein